jgi:hypothetical protein
MLNKIKHDIVFDVGNNTLFLLSSTKSLKDFKSSCVELPIHVFKKNDWRVWIDHNFENIFIKITYDHFLGKTIYVVSNK